MSSSANSVQREEEKEHELKKNSPLPAQQITPDNDIIKCNDCNGKGKWEQCSLCRYCLDGIQSITCIACNGMKICVRCNGTSIYKSLKMRCSDCTPGIGDHPTHMLQQPCSKCNTSGSVSINRIYVNTHGIVSTQSTNHQCIDCNGQGYISDYHNIYQYENQNNTQIANENHRIPSNCQSCNGRRFTLTHLKCSGCVNERDGKCGSCHGLGADERSCNKCQGNGYIFKQGICVKCSGRGFDLNDQRVSGNINNQMSALNISQNVNNANNVSVSQPIGIQCGMCGGSGKCVTCTGSGFYVNEMRMCLSCDGDGRFPRMHAWTCVRCKGRGHFYRSRELCRVCAGSCRFPNNVEQQNVCQKCNGYGRSLFQIACRACDCKQGSAHRKSFSNGLCVKCKGMGYIGIPAVIQNNNGGGSVSGNGGNVSVSGLQNINVGGRNGNDDEKVSEGYEANHNGRGTRLCEKYGVVYCPETDETQ